LKHKPHRTLAQLIGYFLGPAIPGCSPFPRTEPGNGASLADRPEAGPLAPRFEREYCRGCKKSHAAQLGVAMGVSLLVNHLDVPSGQDLVTLEAFTNAGQRLIQFRAIGSDEGHGEKKSAWELPGVRRMCDPLKLRDLHVQSPLAPLARRLRAEVLEDRLLELGVVWLIHRTYPTNELACRRSPG